MWQSISYHADSSHNIAKQNHISFNEILAQLNSRYANQNQNDTINSASIVNIEHFVILKMIPLSRYSRYQIIKTSRYDRDETRSIGKWGLILHASRIYWGYLNYYIWLNNTTLSRRREQWAKSTFVDSQLPSPPDSKLWNLRKNKNMYSVSIESHVLEKIRIYADILLDGWISIEILGYWYVRSWNYNPR